MVLITTLALAEMAVLFPVNGAFYAYVVRFVDPGLQVVQLHIPIPSLTLSTSGFAVGWEYALGWLVTLPFELVAATITIEFWRNDLNMAIWVTVFLFILAGIQCFGVRGYGEGKIPLGCFTTVHN